MSATSKHHEIDAEGRFTSSLALPSEADGNSTSVWLQQDDVRVADLPSLESEQEQRRQELTAYLHHLKQTSPNKKQAGTAFGAEFHSLVQRLSQERKTTYESIRGWIPTPNRLMSPTLLATPSEDPKIQEGLRQILQLDQCLMQKSAEAAMVARETFPEAWLAADKKQAGRDQKQLQASLERERARQTRINKLANAVEALDIDNKENKSEPVSSGRGLYCLLQPAEEDLVDCLLTQDDDAAWGQNPFDSSTDEVTDGTSAESQALADIDAQIQEYRGHHASLQSTAGAHQQAAIQPHRSPPQTPSVNQTQDQYPSLKHL
ncbi:hypothetical protein WJX82_001504 [Trebouxia sp. C0006]